MRILFLTFVVFVSACPFERFSRYPTQQFSLLWRFRLVTPFHTLDFSKPGNWSTTASMCGVTVSSTVPHMLLVPQAGTRLTIVLPRSWLKKLLSVAFQQQLMRNMMTRVGGRVPLQVSPHFDEFTGLIMDVQLGHVFKHQIHELKNSLSRTWNHASGESTLMHIMLLDSPLLPWWLTPGVCADQTCCVFSGPAAVADHAALL
jgi:hypothetical protein